MKQLFTVMQGTGSGTPGKDFRATVDIMVLDHPVTGPKVPVKAIYRVYNAWPTAIAFSDLTREPMLFLCSRLHWLTKDSTTSLLPLSV